MQYRNSSSKFHSYRETSCAFMALHVTRLLTKAGVRSKTEKHNKAPVMTCLHQEEAVLPLSLWNWPSEQEFQPI